jgi:hypothetical protein
LLLLLLLLAAAAAAACCCCCLLLLLPLVMILLLTHRLCNRCLVVALSRCLQVDGMCHLASSMQSIAFLYFQAILYDLRDIVIRHGRSFSKVNSLKQNRNLDLF